MKSIIDGDEIPSTRLRNVDILIVSFPISLNNEYDLHTMERP